MKKRRISEELEVTFLQNLPAEPRSKFPVEILPRAMSPKLSQL